MVIWFSALARAAGRHRRGIGASWSAVAALLIGTGPTVRITSPLGRSGVLRAASASSRRFSAADRRDAWPGPLLHRWPAVPDRDRRRALRRRMDRRESVRAARDRRGGLRRARPRGPRLASCSNRSRSSKRRRSRACWSKRRSRTRTAVSSRALPPSAFTVLEDGVPQDARPRQARGRGRHVRAADRQQRQHVPPARFRAADGRPALAHYMTPLDRMIVAPFSKGLPADDRADRRSRKRWPTRSRRFGSSGGTAILDSLVQLARSFPESTGRRAVILITDGYDENSTHRRRGAGRAEGGAGDGLRGGHRRRRRHLAEGREGAAPPRRRNRRPGIPAATEASSSSSTPRWPTTCRTAIC